LCIRLPTPESVCLLLRLWHAELHYLPHPSWTNVDHHPQPLTHKSSGHSYQTVYSRSPVCALLERALVAAIWHRLHSIERCCNMLHCQDFKLDLCLLKAMSVHK
jgi:hypothetical protein